MNLESLKTAITLMSAVVIPVVLAYLGNMYTKALKEREVQAGRIGWPLAILGRLWENNHTILIRIDVWLGW